MPTSKFILTEAWIKVADAGPCLLEAAETAPMRLYYGAAAPAIDDNGHFSLYHHGLCMGRINYEGEDPVWAKAHQMNIDGTYQPALLVASGATVLGSGGGGLPPAPIRFERVETLTIPLNGVATVAQLLAALGANPEITSIEVIADERGFIKFTDHNGDAKEQTTWRWGKKSKRKLDPAITWTALLQPMTINIVGEAE